MAEIEREEGFSSESLCFILFVREKWRLNSGGQEFMESIAIGDIFYFFLN